MKILALDSSGLVASAAVLEDDQILAEYTVNYKKTHSQTLLPMLDELSRMLELDLSTVDAVAVAAGPGSFTGLRIGSATAKGLGLALGVPLVEVPTLDAMAMNLPFTKGLICPIMDARRQEVYSGIYRFDGGRLVSVREQAALPVLSLVEELQTMPAELTAEGIIFLGDGVPPYQVLIDEHLALPHAYAPANANRQRAASVALLGRRLFEAGKCIPAAEHAPMYLRKSQAEREREEKERRGDE
ncbi:MAG: tRNA (adenosine(37)-N6)-threonylcarbamoyltransferase complex dimerization subunit type 1 TsaB [bacterium]